MDIRNMRQLVAIRTHGSLAKAAAALAISQPSLSTAMARLEDQLGVRLFNRTSTGSELTPIGELIAGRALRVLSETASILRDAELVARGEAGMMRIGIGTALKPNFLQTYVRTIAERHPALRLHVEVLDRDKLLPLLKSRELDLIVCGVGDEIRDEALTITPVLTAFAVAVSSPDHPLASLRGISIAQFSAYPAAGGKPLYSNVDLLDASIIGGPDVSFYTANDYEPMVALALAGACTLIAPSHVVQPQIDSGALVRLDLDWSQSVQFAALTTRAASYSPIIDKMVGYAVSLGGQLQERSRSSGLPA